MNLLIFTIFKLVCSHILKPQCPLRQFKHPETEYGSVLSPIKSESAHHCATQITNSRTTQCPALLSM